MSQADAAATLRVDFAEGEYSAGLSIVNEDSSVIGDVIRYTSHARTSLVLDATYKTGDGTFKSVFEFSQQMSPGETIHFPIGLDITPFHGPGSITLGIQNTGPFDTAVILEVMRQ